MSEDADSATIGQVLSPWGLRGELRVRPFTDFPERFDTGAEVCIDGVSYTIESSRPSKDSFILKLKGIDTPEAAAGLGHKEIVIPAGELKPLPPGRYYQHDIIGLAVWTTDGEYIGRVSQVLTTGCNDVYVVKTDSKEVLIPAVKDVVKEIDLRGKRMVIEAIEGLL